MNPRVFARVKEELLAAIATTIQRRRAFPREELRGVLANYLTDDQFRTVITILQNRGIIRSTDGHLVWIDRRQSESA